jgi:UrcA family protein
MNLITKSAALLLCGFAGMTANAATPADATSVAVKYDPQSLSTESGVVELYQRIQYAANKVCPGGTVRDLAAQHQVQACRREAVARAIAQIDNSRLAALHAGHTKNG